MSARSDGARVSSGDAEELARYLLPFVGASAFLWLLWLTVHGVGISSDSTVYLKAAKSLVMGRGLMADGHPMTHYPPAYPFLIAMSATVTGLDVSVAARWLQALLFAVNSLLIGVIVWRCTRSTVAVASALGLVLTSVPVLLAHTMAWSEALFLIASLCSFWLVAQYVHRPSYGLLIAAAVTAAVAATTRYIGATVVCTAGIVLLVPGSTRSLTRRIADSATLVAVGALPLVAWLVRNLLTAGSATNRTPSYHPIGAGALVELARNFHQLIVPLPLFGFTILSQLSIMGILAVIAGVWLFRQGAFSPHRITSMRVFYMLVPLFCVFYLAFVVFSRSMVDAAIPFDARILMPLWPFISMAAVLAAWDVSTITGRPSVWVAFVALVVAGLSIRVDRLQSWIVEVRTEGLGYESPRWRKSASVVRLRSVDPRVKLYANAPEVLWFVTGRDAAFVPSKISSTSLTANPRLAAELSRLCREVVEGRAVIVFLDQVRRDFLPSSKDFGAACPLATVEGHADGTVVGSRTSLDAQGL